MFRGGVGDLIRGEEIEFASTGLNGFRFVGADPVGGSQAVRIVSGGGGGNKPKAIQSGSGELDFLAANRITDAASEQPLWATARRVAAGNAKNESTMIRLYRAVLAIAPNDDESALQLFRALLQSGRPREAISAIEDRVHIVTELADRARLADAYVRINQLHRATNTFDQIFETGTPAQTNRWRRAAAIVRAQAVRDEQNQMRRPVIAEELEQVNIVKPRLTAQSGGAR